ncbi:MAG: NUDIX domain-containing protein, partial [Patescibacteria group bacterium]
MNKSDIQFEVGDTVFNYRVVVLLNTPEGFMFEKSGDGFLFAVGGKVSINEDSVMTAKRELLEEVGYICHDPRLVAVIENYFLLIEDGRKYHEISFVYHVDSGKSLNLSKFKSNNPHNKGFVSVKTQDFGNVIIKPVVLPKIILENKEFVHVINREI